MSNEVEPPLRTVSLDSVRLAEIGPAVVQSIRLPSHSHDDLQGTLRWTRLAVGCYRLTLAVIVCCVILLILFVRPQENDLGLPSLREFCLWLIPVFTGGIVAFYLARPLFTKSEPKPPSGYVADPDAEAVLYEFVERLCRVLRAPVPERVILSPRPEVAFHPCNGEASVCEERGFDLTIGLPFVVALNSWELAGLIGREVALYTESPQRLSRYRIKVLHEWLEQMANYHSDYEATASDMAADDSVAKPLGVLSEYAFALQRRIKHGVQFLARSASYKAMREWMLEADTLACQLAGSEDYAGRYMVLEGIGVRRVTRVKYLRKGEFVGDEYESSTHKALRAPSAGWYCLFSTTAIRRCDEVKESDFYNTQE